MRVKTKMLSSKGLFVLAAVGRKRLGQPLERML